MQAPDMVDKTFEECIPMIAERTKERMKWVWEEDLDAAYEKLRDARDDGLVQAKPEEKAAAIPNGNKVGIEAQ